MKSFICGSYTLESIVYTKKEKLIIPDLLGAQAISY